MRSFLSDRSAFSKHFWYFQAKTVNDCNQEELWKPVMGIFLNYKWKLFILYLVWVFFCACVLYPIINKCHTLTLSYSLKRLTGIQADSTVVPLPSPSSSCTIPWIRPVNGRSVVKKGSTNTRVITLKPRPLNAPHAHLPCGVFKEILQHNHMNLGLVYNHCSVSHWEAQ